MSGQGLKQVLVGLGERFCAIRQAQHTNEFAVTAVQPRNSEIAPPQCGGDSVTKQVGSLSGEDRLRPASNKVAERQTEAPNHAFFRGGAGSGPYRRRGLGGESESPRE